MLETLENELLIRRVAEQYFHGVDTSDRNLVRACFDDGATAQLNAGSNRSEELIGGDAISERIVALCSLFSSSTHPIANIFVSLSGLKASCAISATAHVLTGEMVQVRGLQYHDQLIFKRGGWLISGRIHSAIWQYNIAATLPQLQLNEVPRRAN